MTRPTAETAKPANGQPAAPPAPRTLDEHLAWLQALEATGVSLRPVAENLFRERFALQAALDKVREHHRLLKEEIETLCEPENYPAVITNVHCNGRSTVEVHVSGMLLEVGV